MATTFSAVREVLASAAGDRNTRLRAIIASAMPNDAGFHANNDGGATFDEAIWLALFIAKTDPSAIYEPCDEMATV